MSTTEERKTSAEEESSPKTDEDALARVASEEEEDEEERSGGPAQLGTGRWVYAAYFAGGIAVAFLASRILDFAWAKLSTLKPDLGEPRDEVLMPISGLIGLAVALYYWRRTRVRQLAEEVAGELSKVTWPSRQDVTNSTFVVIVTTIVSTVFFALMDRFWGFVTNLVYGT